ncbi:MAG TPA: ATP-binding protein [Oligoflexus sp.]|uniref:chemotaxis protein CheA n=1 Tax=Oligoflexus sp. TaxID=1971216 RepID=UPI002D3D29CC|nr:ATP-binding protein [Oligoflexus sp.]HYX34370.1 ATP-binding protein [Oligoflexus sp.]
MALNESIFLTFLDEAEDALHEWETLCLSQERNPDDAHLNELFRIAHNIKGSSRIAGLTSLGRLVHTIEDLLALLKNKKIPWTKEIGRTLLNAHSCLNDWVRELRKQRDHGPDYEPDITELGQQLLGLLGHSIQSAATSSPAFQDGFIMFEEEPIAKQAADDKTPLAFKASMDDTIRVSTSKVDQLLRLVSELSIAKSILVHAHKRKVYDEQIFDDAMQELNTVDRELQSCAFGLRMQPLGKILQRLERTAQDVAHELGKQVDVHIIGEETELDRTVAEKVISPLIHIVRNAIDHGIESVEQRLALGKNPKGSLQISAENNGSYVLLSVVDDGGGLNADRIRAKAIERKIIDEKQQVSESELHSMILLPGFSTADKVTDISGRGVGMDVVKNVVESLGGQLDVKSQFKRGTQIKIVIPTSMSMVDALTVHLDQNTYAIPLSETDEVLDIDSSIMEKTHLNGETILRQGELVPLESLRKYIPVSEVRSTESEEFQHRVGLLTRVGNDFVAFEVDRVISRQSIYIRPLPENLEGYQGVMGSTILTDGKPALILSLHALGIHYLERSKRKQST